MTNSPARPDRSRLEAFLEADPVLGRVREAARSGGGTVYLVGGAIRDALCGFPVDDIDLVTEADPTPLIRQLDPSARLHDRFGTAELLIDGFPVDLARARTETYPFPGSLPVVTFGSLTDDLYRRDFTVNAIALPLAGQRERELIELIDPFDGVRDLEAGRLRLLHDESFRDDPTRAIRAARYAARLEFSLDPGTEALLPTVDFSTISADRYRAELRLAAAEPRGIDALILLARWGLLNLEPTGPELARSAIALLETDLWRAAANRAETVLRACLEPPRAAIETLAATPQTPWAGVGLASRFTTVELLLARAAGAAWLDCWRKTWRNVTLEIAGGDLLAAGIPQGPAIGAGIEAARRARLDRGISGKEAELEVALAAAREVAGTGKASGA